MVTSSRTSVASRRPGERALQLVPRRGPLPLQWRQLHGAPPRQRRQRHEPRKRRLHPHQRWQWRPFQSQGHRKRTALQRDVLGRQAMRTRRVRLLRLLLEAEVVDQQQRVEVDESVVLVEAEVVVVTVKVAEGGVEVLVPVVEASVRLHLQRSAFPKRSSILKRR